MGPILAKIARCASTLSPKVPSWGKIPSLVRAKGPEIPSGGNFRASVQLFCSSRPAAGAAGCNVAGACRGFVPATPARSARALSACVVVVPGLGAASRTHKSSRYHELQVGVLGPEGLCVERFLGERATAFKGCVVLLTLDRPRRPSAKRPRPRTDTQ